MRIFGRFYVLIWNFFVIYLFWMQIFWFEYLYLQYIMSYGIFYILLHNHNKIILQLYFFCQFGIYVRAFMCCKYNSRMGKFILHIHIKPDRTWIKTLCSHQPNIFKFFFLSKKHCSNASFKDLYMFSQRAMLGCGLKTI